MFAGSDCGSGMVVLFTSTALVAVLEDSELSLLVMAVDLNLSIPVKSPVENNHGYLLSKNQTYFAERVQ